MAKKGLSRAQVEHIARLALLPLTVKETPVFQEQLSEVVEYVGKIEEVKRKTPQYHTVRGRQNAKRKETRMVSVREDVVGATKCLSQEDALSGTEDKHNGLFLVPAIFED